MTVTPPSTCHERGCVLSLILLGLFDCLRTRSRAVGTSPSRTICPKGQNPQSTRQSHALNAHCVRPRTTHHLAGAAAKLRKDVDAVRAAGIGHRVAAQVDPFQERQVAEAVDLVDLADAVLAQVQNHERLELLQAWAAATQSHIRTPCQMALHPQRASEDACTPTLKGLEVVAAQAELAHIAQRRHNVLDRVNAVVVEVELGQLGEKGEIIDGLDRVVRKVNVLQVRREFLSPRGSQMFPDDGR